MSASEGGRYRQIIERIFFDHYSEGVTAFDFDREEIATSADVLGLQRPANLGDTVYTFRYRAQLPKKIRDTCPPGYEWIIKGVPGTGDTRYRFRMVPETKIEPQSNRFVVKVPDATPEIVTQHALSDEQALLAKLRYNRLIDIFTGITTYSLQNHLRTQVNKVQIEVDELYLGVGTHGTQYVLPVQAKVGKDRIGRVQLEQDIDFCRARYPELICRAIGAKELANDVIVLFELVINDDQGQVVDERHYRLVPAASITASDLDAMRQLGAPV